jgi:hypothetical protein
MVAGLGEVQDRGLAAVSGSGDRPIWFRLVMQSSPVDAA